MPSGPLLAVDAPSLLHRNHHARAQSGLLDQGGRPAWALHGMLRQILEAIDQFAPDAVLFGLDYRASSVREQAYPAYKAGRAAKDPQLVDQAEAARIRGLTPYEQVPEVFRLESQGIYFAKDLSKSIIYSVAPPGASHGNRGRRPWTGGSRLRSAP